jgi:parallel beta-helix repeat protein
MPIKTTLRSGAGTLSVLTLLAALAGSNGAIAGDLNPPSGAVAPTMKTLEQVESRTAIPGGLNQPTYTITEPGSYYLTGNRVTTSSGLYESIVVEASNVTIDLNGFSIIMQNSFMQHGVYIADTNENAAHSNITVKNGTLSGAFSDSPLAMGNGVACRVQNVTVRGATGATGIEIGRGGVVTDSIVENCNTGFSGNHATFVNCTATYNQTTGFSLYQSVARECDARFNGDFGFVANTRCVIERSSAMDNDPGGPGAGIYVFGDGSRIDNNTLSGGYYGVFLHNAATNSFVTRNAVRIGNGAPFAMNGQVAGNFPNNHVAQILTDPTNQFTTTNPWANFAH